MGILSNLGSNLSNALKNVGSAATQISGTFGPIVSAFNPGAGAILNQIGNYGQAAVALTSKPPKPVTVQAQAGAAAAVAVPVDGSSFGSAFGGMSPAVKYGLIGGGALVLVIVLYMALK